MESHTTTSLLCPTVITTSFPFLVVVLWSVQISEKEVYGGGGYFHIEWYSKIDVLCSKQLVLVLGGWNWKNSGMTCTRKRKEMEQLTFVFDTTLPYNMYMPGTVPPSWLMVNFKQQQRTCKNNSDPNKIRNSRTESHHKKVGINWRLVLSHSTKWFHSTTLYWFEPEGVWSQKVLLPLLSLN